SMNTVSTGIKRNPGSAWVLSGILCLAALVYAGSLGNQFVWDDHWVIVENDFVKSARNLPLLFTRQYLTSPREVNSVRIKSIGSGEFSYRPLVTATYFIDYRIWKLNPLGFHLTNLFLHLANILLFYFLALGISEDEKSALLSAALFSLHPANAEAVSVVTHREDLLAFFFFVCAFLLFLRAQKVTGKKRVRRKAASVCCFLLALFSKEMAVTLPAVLMVYDYFFTFKLDFRDFLRRWRDRYSGYIIAALCYLVIWGVIFRNTASGDPAGLRFPVSAAVVFLSFSRAVYWLFFPPAIHPTLRGDDILLFLRTGIPGLVFSVVLGAVCLAGAFKARKRSPVIFFSIIYFFIALLPVLNFVPMVNVSASRLLYIPIAGFCLLIPSLLLRIPGNIPAYVFLFLLAGYAVVTPVKNLAWKNDLFLGLRLVESYPESAEAHGTLAAEYLKEGLAGKAISEYRKAISLNPYLDRYYNGLGLSYYRKGDFDAAIEEYKKASGLSPSSPGFLINLALAYKEKGSYRQAVVCLESALRINPRLTLALDNLAVIYNEIGDVETARRLWEKSLEIYPAGQNALTALRALGK
ncbi:MAG: tetratricopeptide repeat protein, partial [Candidatus Aenigmarchaeota archaeon]|nr:tetratricopeptide repeat protein [Candidatus Aenigmarchaeota archaeon]